MTPKGESVAVEHVADKGTKKWRSARLYLDPVAGTVELKGRGRLRKRWTETYQASQVSEFEIVMVGDRLAKVYGSLIGLSALLILSTWVPDDTFWEPVVDLGKYIVSAAVGWLFAQWNKVPVIRLRRSTGENTYLAEAERYALLDDFARSDPETLLKNQAFRRELSSMAQRMIGQQRYKDLRIVLDSTTKNPSAALSEMFKEMHSLGERWVHISAAGGNSRRTRGIALQIEELLRQHRYGGMMPDLSDGVRWRLPFFRTQLSMAVAFLVLLVGLFVTWAR